jgi:hypothetical protein
MLLIPSKMNIAGIRATVAFSSDVTRRSSGVGRLWKFTTGVWLASGDALP